MRYYWVLLVILLIILSSFHGEVLHSQYQDTYLEEGDNPPTLYCERVPQLCFSSIPGSECHSYCERAISFCCNHPIEVPWTPTDIQNCYNSIYAVQASGCV